MNPSLDSKRPHIVPGLAFRRATALMAVLFGLLTAASRAGESSPANSRRPANDEDLKYWLQNMTAHRFTAEEMTAATGLAPEAVRQALERFAILPGQKLPRPPGSSLLVLPYPGGRHPRIGFLDGAINPQRETKISVFLPWDESSYVVVDVPEAIWSNLGLTYLAHTHIPTVFDKQGVRLEPLEWNRRVNGGFDISRALPSGISFRAEVRPATNVVLMDLWLTNGTQQALSDLRVQNCVMLRGAAGFTAQTNANKILSKPYVAARSDSGNRWIITAWEPCDRPWANPPVPCLHSDPKFPDCPPGEIRRLRGWLSFYEGTDIESEFKRIEQTGWRR